MLYVETGSTDPYYNFGLEYWLITEKLLEDDTVFLFCAEGGSALFMVLFVLF